MFQFQSGLDLLTEASSPTLPIRAVGTPQRTAAMAWELPWPPALIGNLPAHFLFTDHFVAQFHNEVQIEHAEGYNPGEIILRHRWTPLQSMSSRFHPRGEEVSRQFRRGSDPAGACCPPHPPDTQMVPKQIAEEWGAGPNGNFPGREPRHLGGHGVPGRPERAGRPLPENNSG